MSCHGGPTRAHRCCQHLVQFCCNPAGSADGDAVVTLEHCCLDAGHGMSSQAFVHGADQLGCTGISLFTPHSSCSGPQHGADWRVCICAAFCRQPAWPAAIPGLHAPHGYASPIMMQLWPGISSLASFVCAVRSLGFTVQQAQACEEMRRLHCFLVLCSSIFTIWRLRESTCLLLTIADDRAYAAPETLRFEFLQASQPCRCCSRPSSCKHPCASCKNRVTAVC